MIPQAPYSIDFENLNPDKVLHARKSSGQRPKIVAHLADFFSVRRCVGAFYTAVGLILFTGFVLSKDSFDEYHTAFDSVAIIQTQSPPSTQNHPEVTTPTAAPLQSQREESDEDTSFGDGIIIRHPFSSSEDELPPQNPSPPSMTKSHNSLPLAESSTPGPPAIQLHTGFSPPWSTNTQSQDPSSFNLSQPSDEKMNDPPKKP